MCDSASDLLRNGLWLVQQVHYMLIEPVAQGEAVRRRRLAAS